MEKGMSKSEAKELFDSLSMRKYFLGDELRFDFVDSKVIEEMNQINYELNELRNNYGL